MCAMDSPQRKKFNKTVLGFMQDPEKLHLLRTMLCSPETAKEEDEPKAETTKHKIGTFWSSGPVWAVVGMIATLVATQLSLKLLFAVAWAVVFIEFVRCGFFAKRATQILGNATAGVILVAVFYGGWKMTPKPKEEPTLDQQLAAFANKFPWLAHPPEKPTPVAVSSQSSTEPQAFIGNTNISLGQYSVGAPLETRIDIKNISQAIANNAGAIGQMYVVDTKPIGIHGEHMVPKSEDDRTYALFLKDAKRRGFTKTYGPGETAFLTAYGPELTLPMKDKLEGLQAEKALLVHAEFGWEDHGGKHMHEFCMWLQPGYLGVTGQSQVWHNCFGHNGMRH